MGSRKCQRCRIPQDCPFGLLFGRVRTLIEWRSYEAHCTVFKQDQPAEGLYVIHSGRLGLYFESEGEKIYLGDADPGWVLGVVGTLKGSSHLYTAEAEERSELEFLPKDHLLSLLDSHPELAPTLLVTVAQRSNELIAKMLKRREARNTPPGQS
ncbi:MAG: hypothetical protein EHM23_06910 [Acidobacteria bacterium]|nr:MAG: hypothetical protein EHM23_06910 [Acidobacteriota bacterium]